MSELHEGPTGAAGKAGAPETADSGPLRNVQLPGAFALLAELTQKLADSADLDATLERALERISEHLEAEAGSIWLADERGEELVCRAQTGPGEVLGVHLSTQDGILGRSVRENSCQLVADVRQDPEFFGGVDEKSDFVTQSVVCAPLSVSDRALGAIELVNKRGGGRRFTEGDRHVLRVLAASAALAIGHARLAELAAHSERVRRELELAAEIQRSLLPAPQPPPFPAVGLNLPARSVSGDFFDFLEREDGSFAFCLGDVSGKGINAALLATQAASLYRYLARNATRPANLLWTLNRELAQTTTRGMFVTMLAGELDPLRGVFRLASAGHIPALLHDAQGGFTAIPAQAPPLAVLAAQEFPAAEFPASGSTLYVFSDGLTEAHCEAGREFGDEGVKELVTRFAAKPLAERAQSIMAHVQQLDRRDDVTLLAVNGDGPAD